jgi:AbrB family looped-hinge helix DNA binding protein
LATQSISVLIDAPYILDISVWFTVTYVRKVTSGCRVTIPKRIRENLGIKSRDIFRLVQTGEVCWIEKVRTSEK